jgi:MFS family permease
MFELLKTSPLLRRLMIGRFISGFADQFLLFSIPLLVLQVTGSVAKSGASFFIEWLPRVISLPIAGSSVAAIGRARVLVLADALRASLLLALFFLLQRTHESEWFLPLSLGSGICSFIYAHSFIALESVLPQTVGKENLHRGQATIQASEQASVLLGALCAGLASDAMGKKYLILIAALMFSASFVNVSSIRRALIQNENSAGNRTAKLNSSWLDRALQGFRIVLRDSVLSSMVIVALFLNLLVGSTLAINPALAKNVFKVSDSIFSLLNGTVGVLSICALVLVPSVTKKVELRILSRISLVSICLFALLLTTVASFPIHVVGFGGVLAATMLYNVYMRTTRARRVDAGALPNVIASMVFLNQLAMPISGLLVAFLGSSQTPSEILRLMIFTSLIGMVLGIWLLIRSERAERAELEFNNAATV